MPETTTPTEAEWDELLGKPGPPIEVDPEQLAAAVALQRAEAKSQTTVYQQTLPACPHCGRQMQPIAVPASMIGGFVCEDHCEERKSETTAADRIADALDEIIREKPDLWRVDVGGVPILVKGKPAYEYLQHINSRMAKMKLALHRIKGGHSADPQLDAIKALQDD